jgi:hypothetical protein
LAFCDRVRIGTESGRYTHRSRAARAEQKITPTQLFGLQIGA